MFPLKNIFNIAPERINEESEQGESFFYDLVIYNS